MLITQNLTYFDNTFHTGPFFFAENKNVLKGVELYFDIGSREKLHCSINNKTNHARWVINGRKLEITNSTSQRIRAGDNGDLFIEDVQLSDGGIYECQRLEYVQYNIVYINGMKKQIFLYCRNRLNMHDNVM